MTLARLIQPDLAPVGPERDAFMVGRRAAIVGAVHRLFPTVTNWPARARLSVETDLAINEGPETVF